MIIILSFVSVVARAADIVTDPRRYCDHVAELVAAGDADSLATDLYAHSNGSISDIEFKAALGGLAPLSAKAGFPQSQEHVSEWRVGESYVRHWYILVYEGGPLFVRCIMYKAGNRWFVNGFYASTDPEKIGLSP